MEVFKSDKVLWTIVAAVVVVFIVLGLASTHTSVSYKLSPEATLQEMLSDSNVVDFTNLKSLSNNEKLIFIDLRGAKDYNFRHYKGSINIPADQITKEENLDNLEKMQAENNTLVIYGSIPQEAATSWTLLKQLGIKNIKMYNGTVDQLMLDSTPVANIYNEIPLTDTTIFSKRKAVVVQQKEEKPAPRKPVTRIQEEPSTGGGC